MTLDDPSAWKQTITETLRQPLERVPGTYLFVRRREVTAIDSNDDSAYPQDAPKRWQMCVHVADSYHELHFASREESNAKAEEIARWVNE
jgi:hypothetical protein